MTDATENFVLKAIGTLLTLFTLDIVFWKLAKQPKKHKLIHIPDDCPACTQIREEMK